MQCGFRNYPGAFKKNGDAAGIIVGARCTDDRVDVGADDNERFLWGRAQASNDIAKSFSLIREEIAFDYEAVVFKFLRDKTFHRGQMGLSAEGTSFANDHLQIAAQLLAVNADVHDGNGPDWIR